jgi:tetratricopeptide (TPR) repeat protein
LKKKDFKKAEELFVRVMELAPAYWYPYFFMGRLYGYRWEQKKVARDLLDKAVNYMREAIKTKKDFFDAYYYAAELLEKGGKIGEAIKWIKDMIGVRKEMLRELSRKKENERQIRKVKWKLCRAYIYLGKLYEAKRDIKKAIKCGEDAIRTRADFFDAYYYLARVYERQKKVDKAVECMRRMIAVRERSLARLPPGDKRRREAVEREIGKGYLFAGLYFAKAGRHREAVAEFKRAVRFGIDVGGELEKKGMRYLKENSLYRNFFAEK